MIIQSFDKCYEVMREMGSTGRISEFFCREQLLKEDFLLVRITEPTLAERFTLFLEEKVRGAEFPDYKECFQTEGDFYAVFTYSPEKTLKEKLDAESCTREERAEMAHSLLEQLVLRSPHPYFVRNSLQPDMITVSESLDVSWNYHLDEVLTFDYCTMEVVRQRLAEVMKLLFGEELSGRRYPALENYLSALEGERIPDYLELYQAFLPVYEALGTEGEEYLHQTFLERLYRKFQRLGDKPDSLRGYVRFGKRYVAKKLIPALVTAALLIPLAILWLIFPWIQSRFLTKTMVIHSRDTEGYTGKVRLVGDLEADNVIFVGTLKEGRINGLGTLYDEEGHLLYQGEFLADQYSGVGKSYYANGNIEYTGEFASGQFEGKGKLYEEDGALIYEGEFSLGMYEGSGLLYQSGELLYQGSFSEGIYEGNGMLYYSGGAPAYEGGFSQGSYEGNGTLYYPNGSILYRGSFSQGSYEGVGALFYQNGVTSYEGEFFQGMRSGSGKAYDESGVLLYEGTFARGEYEGEGTLYEEGQVACQGFFHRGEVISGAAVLVDGQGELLYQGDINNGLYEGQGKFFSEGILIYEGGFADGKYHGSGKEYQEGTGRLLYDGMFEQGIYSGEGRLYDGKTGGLLYEGSFYQGKYDGTGKLYDPKRGYLVYEGGFREGKYDGKGKSYSSGVLAYEGEFLLNQYNGMGILYDLATGAVVYEGVFYKNRPLVELAGSGQEDAPSPKETDGNGTECHCPTNGQMGGK